MGRGILLYGAASRGSGAWGTVCLSRCAAFYGRGTLRLLACRHGSGESAGRRPPGTSAPAIFLKESNRPAKTFHLSSSYCSGWPACPAFPFHRPARARRGFVTFQLVELS